MLDDEKGYAARVQLAHELDQARDRALIDAAGHLVEEKQPRLRRERPRELEALALPGRERARVGVRLVEETDAAQPFVRLVAPCFTSRVG